MPRMEHVAEAAKTLPPATVGVLTIFGVSVQNWVQILTIAWMLLLIAGKLREFYSQWKAWRDREKSA